MPKIKNIINLIIKHLFTSSDLLHASSYEGCFLISTTAAWDKNKYLSPILKIWVIKKEIIILGKKNPRSYKPWSTYILWIVVSLKNKALIAEQIAKFKINKSIFIIFEL